MIISSLKYYLTERNLTAFKLSKLTGTPRTFIQNLIDNEFQLLNTKYLDSLCKYLGETPNNFIHYYPFDFKICVINFGTQIMVDMKFYDDNKGEIFYLNIKKIGSSQSPIIDIDENSFERWSAYFQEVEYFLFEWLINKIETTYREQLNYSLETFIFTIRTTAFIDLD